MAALAMSPKLLLRPSRPLVCYELGCGAAWEGAREGWMEPEKWWLIELLHIFLFGARDGGSKDELVNGEHRCVLLVTILVYSPFFIFDDLDYKIIT